jgi:hypothetical protein
MKNLNFKLTLIYFRLKFETNIIVIYSCLDKYRLVVNKMGKLPSLFRMILLNVIIKEEEDDQL